MEFPLAPFFLKQLLEHAAELSDMESLDSEMFKHLMFLETYEGDVEDLALTFTIRKEVNGILKEVCLFFLLFFCLSQKKVGLRKLRRCQTIDLWYSCL